MTGSKKREPTVESVDWNGADPSGLMADRSSGNAYSAGLAREPLARAAAAQRIGEAGQFPYTRGIHADMYRSKLWTMRQYAGFGSAAETNVRLRQLLDSGQTGLSLAFDLPTQLGYDPDHPLARGEVGKVGVSVSSAADMEAVLRGIPLERVSTSMTINAPAAALLAMYIAVAEKCGIPANRLSGTVQNDILKEYTARGTYIFPPEPSLRLTADLIEYCSRCMPRWNPISVSGYHMREAGATAAQELGFAFANAIAYIDAAIARGLHVDEFAPRLSFFFAAGPRLLEEAAKFRAARRLWSQLMRSRYGAREPKSLQLRVHAQTTGSALTAQQPDNNAARVTLQALAAVLGGVQSLHTNAIDEALGLPTDATARAALRTQQVIAFESGVAEQADPLGGSPYIENMTDRLEDEAASVIRSVDAFGGAVNAIKAGYVQREIERSAFAHHLGVESGQIAVVGVNCFALDAEAGACPPPAQPSPRLTLLNTSNLEQTRREALERVRRVRSQPAVVAMLDELKDTASTSSNVMPSMIKCVKAGATIGEICGVLRDSFGEFVP